MLPPVETETEPRAKAPAVPGPMGLVLIGLACAVLMTILGAQLIGDFTIAFTLVTCIFAAIVVAAFRRLEG